MEPISHGPTDVESIRGLPIAEHWTFKGGAYLAGPPVAIGRFVATGDRKGRVHFLDANSGKSKAQLKGKGAICRPLSWDESQLYVVSQHAGRSLQCFDFKRGKLSWFRKYRQLPEAPIRSGVELWVPVGDTIHALDPATGNPQRVVLGGGDLWLSPVPWGTGWAVLGRNGRIVALDARGNQLWWVDLESPCLDRPAVAGDSLCVVTGDGSVICLASDGVLAWRTTLDSTALFTAAVGTNEICVGARSGKVWMLDRRDGSVDWERSLEAPLSGAPLLDPDWVAVTRRDGHLELLDRNNGATLQTVSYDSILPFAPAWAFGRLYVVDSERKLHALGTAP